MLTGLDKNSKISIIMPAYNEGRHIYNNIKDVVYLFQNLGHPFEIIVIDDASLDNTLTETKKAQANFNNIIIARNEINYGKGWSIKKGFSLAAGDYIVFLDADLELNPKQLEHFFEIMQHKQSDVVIGCKRHPQSKISYPLHRRIISIGYFSLVKLLFGLPIRDTQTGLKLFKYKVLEKVMPKLLIKTYAFDLEILVLAHTFGYKICEAPVEVNYKGKFGRIGLFSIVTILIDTLAIYYRLKILKYYDYPRAKLTVMPKVSVIIAVKEKTRYLEECIKFCKMLDYPDYEIIVLPDQKICLTEKDIKIIPTGEVLPPKKRDIGSSYAAGEVLAFLDDDSYPREDWLKQAVKNFSHRDVVAVGGPAVDTPNDSPQQHASGTIFSSWIVSGNYVFRYVPKVLRESDDLPSCNFLVKKEDYQKVGGFSAKFWPGEDTFLCFKLTRLLKKKILYDPEVIVYHHRRALFLPHLRQISRYALHRGYFAKRFPQTSLKLAYFLPSLFVSYIFGGVISFVYLNTFSRFAFLSSLLLYLALVAFASAKALNLRLIGLTFIGIILTHLTYGIFLIKGLFSLRMPEEGVNSDAAK